MPKASRPWPQTISYLKPQSRIFAKNSRNNAHYVEADLAMKERALARIAPTTLVVRRFKSRRLALSVSGGA